MTETADWEWLHPSTPYRGIKRAGADRRWALGHKTAMTTHHSSQVSSTLRIAASLKTKERRSPEGARQRRSEEGPKGLTADSDESLEGVTCIPGVVETYTVKHSRLSDG